MIIERHAVDYWIKNKSIDFSIKEIAGNVSVHRHEFYEIELILEGSGIYNIDGIDYKLGRGSLFAMSPISFHQIKFTSNTKLINLMFTINSCNMDFLPHLFVQQPHFAITVPERDIDFLKNLAEEAVKKSNYNSNECTPYESAILSCYLGKVSDLLSTEKPLKEISDIQYAILFLQNNFTEKIFLEDAAKIANYTPNYFCSQFKKFTGVTFVQYLNDLRFSYAVKLLLNTNISVSQICSRCGFNDFSYFMKAFKRKYGVTPMQYRTERQNGE